VQHTIRAALRSDAPPGFRCPERPSKLYPFKEEIHESLSQGAAAPIYRGWASARHVVAVYYLAVPAPASALRRAIEQTLAFTDQIPGAVVRHGGRVRLDG
jgi:hypothetical protein